MRRQRQTSEGGEATRDPGAVAATHMVRQQRPRRPVLPSAARPARPAPLDPQAAHSSQSTMDIGRPGGAASQCSRKYEISDDFTRSALYLLFNLSVYLCLKRWLLNGTSLWSVEH